jgi:histidine triad (HIT) family protein
MTECIFCRIVRGEVPAQVVHRDDAVTAFRDINPVAPVHVLLVPNEHLTAVGDAGPQHEALLGRLLRAAAAVAAREGLAERGYRLVTNAGPDAGQLVPHLHFHLLGGRAFAWPPG